MYICITFFTLNNCVWNFSVGARSEMSLLNLVRTQQPWLLGLGFWFCHAFWTKNCASCGYGKAPPPRRQAGARTQEAGCLIWRRWAVSKLSPACLLAVSEFQIGSNRFLLLPFACQRAISYFLPLEDLLWLVKKQWLWRFTEVLGWGTLLAAGASTCACCILLCNFTGFSRLQLPMRGAFQPQHIARSLSRNLEDPGNFFGIWLLLNTLDTASDAILVIEHVLNSFTYPYNPPLNIFDIFWKLQC